MPLYLQCGWWARLDSNQRCFLRHGFTVRWNRHYSHWPIWKNIPRLSTEQKVGVHQCVNQILVIPHKETKSHRLESTTKRRRHSYKKVCVLDSFYYHASSKWTWVFLLYKNLWACCPCGFTLLLRQNRLNLVTIFLQCTQSLNVFCSYVIHYTTLGIICQYLFWKKLKIFYSAFWGCKMRVINAAMPL